MSVLEIGDGVFEVKATAGDNHLGGDNFDKAIVDWLVSEFKKAEGVDLSQDKMALQRLYQEAEKAKTELSSARRRRSTCRSSRRSTRCRSTSTSGSPARS